MSRPSRYHLRPFEASDAPAFAEAVRESMGTVGVWMEWAQASYNAWQALDWFRRCDELRAAGAAHEFAIIDADQGRLVGGAGLNQLDTANARANLGYWVRESAQRQGAASAAVHALLARAWGPLALARVEIVVAEGNTASYGVASKAGATLEGLARHRLRLRGRFVNAHVFSLIAPDARA